MYITTLNLNLTAQEYVIVLKPVDLNFEAEKDGHVCFESKRTQNEMYWINLLRSEIKHTLVKGRIRYKPRGEGR